MPSKHLSSLFSIAGDYAVENRAMVSRRLNGLFSETDRDHACTVCLVEQSVGKGNEPTVALQLQKLAMKPVVGARPAVKIIVIKCVPLPAPKP